MRLKSDYLLGEQFRTLNTIPKVSNHDEVTGIARHNLLLGQAASGNGKKKVNTGLRQKLDLRTSQIQKIQIHSILVLKENLTF